MLGADALVVLLSKEEGKISVIAKGIHTLTSKRIAALQTGNIVVYDAKKGTGVSLYLTHVELVSHLSTLKRESQGMKHIYLLLYLYDTLIPAFEPDPTLYTFCKKQIISLAGMGSAVPSDFVLVNTILSKLGYGTFASLEDCIQAIEQMIGKKIPKSII